MNYAAEIESLWHEYHTQIAGYIAKRVRSAYGQDAVDDLTSTVFVRAWVAISNGNGYHSSASGWLFQIARNAMKDFWRAMKHRHFVDWEELMHLDDGSEPVPDQVERTATADALHKAINRLADTQSQSVQLRLEGYTNLEIAEIMQSNEMAVKQLNTRAYSNLRDWLREVN